MLLSHFPNFEDLPEVENFFLAFGEFCNFLL